ncbi:MAG: DUF3313 domain-containing protein [Verrucomicrobiaceae bacterium]|nr:DUF3313 domain-containing protein [Verrucomicrobiaceae bacterium]
MIIRYVFLLCPVLFLIGCETTEPGVKRHYISSYRGMSEDASSVVNKALVKKSDPAVLKKYTKVMIEDVKVIPAKDLPENQKTATREEGERLAEAFEETLKKEFGNHYQITNRRGRNTLRVRAALTDLQPSNPGVFVFNYLPYAGVLTTGMTLATGKTPGAGSTSMEAEVLDSRSRRQLYAIIDQHKGSKFQPGGIEKWGQTEGAMRTWSRKIRLGVQAPPDKPEKVAKVAKPEKDAKKAEKPVAKTTTKKAKKEKPSPKSKDSDKSKKTDTSEKDENKKKLWVWNTTSESDTSSR